MDAVDTINKEIQQSKKKQRRKKQKDAMVNKDALSERLRRQRIADNILISWEHSKSPALQELAEKQRRYVTELSKLPGPYQDYYPCNGDQEVAVYDPSMQKNPFVDFKEDLSLTEADHLGSLQKMYFILAYRCRSLSNNGLFQIFINLVIVFAAGLVGIQANEPTYALDTMKMLDEIVSFIFLVEVIVHIVAEGFTPQRFFYGSPESGWNRLDFIIVASSYSEFGSLALLFRMVRLARVLKALKALPQLRVMVQALVNSMDSITFVCILMFLVYYIFAIFGMMLFKKNDPWHFRNLHVTIMTLFRVASGEDWTDVMYTAQYGCKAYPSPSLEKGACTDDNNEAWGMSSVAYFVVFFTLGGLVFLNLFIGVITAGMADALGGYEGEKVVIDRLEDFIFYNNISDGTRDTKDGGIDPLYYAEDDVVGYLNKAFAFTDITNYSHLDREDLKTALHAVHLAPTEAELDLLMEPTNGLFVGCRAEIVGHKNHDFNGIRGIIDRKAGPDTYELKVDTGFSTTKRVLESINLTPENCEDDSTTVDTLDKASWVMVFVNEKVLLGMKSMAEIAHEEAFKQYEGSKGKDEEHILLQSKKVIV